MNQPQYTSLFLCTGNSCRSQMAEGWAKSLKNDLYDVYSAGVDPHGMNPDAIAVMQEVGVDISKQTSDHIDSFLDIGLDLVVTVCDHAHETCPLFRGNTEVVHIGFDDPPRLAAGAESDEERLAPYRRVRDEIRAFVDGLPESLSG